MVGEAEARTDDHIEAFILRWAQSGAAERANFQPFLTELCGVLGVDRPDPASADAALNRYTFECPVTFPDGSTGFIDLYKRGAFVMEAKQGSDQQLKDQLALFGGLDAQTRRGTAVRGTGTWTVAMQRARGQAESYAKAVPVDHGWPPFLIIVDIGHCFELYADFSLTGKSYSQFPDAQSFRIPLEALHEGTIRERLRLIWTDPLSLDPSKHAAEVTRDVSKRLAVVARALESDGHHPELVAGFLMRCLFCMFAEDVGLLPSGSFTKLLEGRRGRDPMELVYALETLWGEMDQGKSFSAFTDDRLLQFNGGLFRERRALPLKPVHLGLLIDAAKADWRHVEPAIFGTFLEQALDARERRNTGVQFTPRRWVERLVMPAVIEPLREQWDTVKASALAFGIAGDRKAAVKAVKEFHYELCHLRILDPACGSGNFLYVTMEHLKRLEGEVIDLLRNDLDEPEATLELERFTVDPHQFLGIETNPRAATIAEVVLWIGYLQWHFRTRGRVMPAQPVLKNFKNIWNRDAVLDYDRKELVLDEHGRPATRWDGHSMKTDLITGREVPDESKRVEIYRYINPRPAVWPEADFVVGNPPFVGDKRMKDALGIEYAQAIRRCRGFEGVTSSSDYVLYWWSKAASLLRQGKLRRFGLISTNSIRQNFNSRVLEYHLKHQQPISLAFAIPDHPWYLGGDMASVRIAMTVGVAGKRKGQLLRLVQPSHDPERGGDDLQPARFGVLNADLTIGVDVLAAHSLRSNQLLSCPGVKLFGQGFILENQDDARRLRYGSADEFKPAVRPYLSAADVKGRPQNRFVIDIYHVWETHQCSEADIRSQAAPMYDYLLRSVYPERAARADRTPNAERYAKAWWLFGEPQAAFRRALSGLRRFALTLESSRYRYFVFADSSYVVEGSLIIVATEDAFHLGVLSSCIHTLWIKAQPGRLGVGNDLRYNKTRCFDPFPFPSATEECCTKIGEAAEELDRHRKRILAREQDLTLTALYRVLEKRRRGQALTKKGAGR